MLPTLVPDSRWNSLQWLIPHDVLSDVSQKDVLFYELPKLAMEDLALLQFTSGSTGDPKGVMVTYGGLLHNCHLGVILFGFNTFMGAEPSIYIKGDGTVGVEHFAVSTKQVHKTSVELYGHRVRCFSWLPVYHDMGCVTVSVSSNVY